MVCLFVFSRVSFFFKQVVFCFVFLLPFVFYTFFFFFDYRCIDQLLSLDAKIETMSLVSY